MKDPSFKEIRKYLTECVFNPKKPGPMSIIAEVDDHRYYENRAIEFIKFCNDNNYNDNLTRAIKLLTLAKLKRDKLYEENRGSDISEELL